MARARRPRSSEIEIAGDEDPDRLALANLDRGGNVDLFLQGDGSEVGGLSGGVDDYGGVGTRGGGGGGDRPGEHRQQDRGPEDTEEVVVDLAGQAALPLQIGAGRTDVDRDPLGSDEARPVDEHPRLAVGDALLQVKHRTLRRAPAERASIS
jgi:hypothetical protein